MAKKNLTGVVSQSEHEITQELAGQVGDNGEMMVPEQVAKEEGFNAEAVQTNRRTQSILKKKQAGEKHVPWGERDACLLYDNILLVHPANTLGVSVKRLTGAAASMYLTGFPRNGRELYKAIKTQFHGRREECEYRVAIQDAGTTRQRGVGYLTMPDTTEGILPPQPPEPQQPQPSPYYGGYGQQPPHQGYPPLGYPQQAPYPQQPQYPPQPPQALPPPPPIVVQAPPPPPPQYIPQPAPAGPDIATVMALQKQLSDISARLDATLKGQPMSAPAPAQQHAAPSAPPFVPPPGYVIMITAGGPQVIVPASEVGLGAGPGGTPGGAGPFGGPHRGGMPSMFDRGNAAAAPPPPPAPPPLPPSAAEQFQKAIGLIRAAADAATSIQRFMPGLGVAAAPAAAPSAAPKPEEEGPTKIVKLGDINAVLNTADGSLRLVDTALANSDKIKSWIDNHYQDAMLRQQTLAQGLPTPPPRAQQ